MPAVLLAPESPPLVLEPNDTAPGKARCYLTERFRELGHADDFVGRLVVTELVTNSFKYVGVGQIVVRVFPDGCEPLTVIEVEDEGTALPVVRDEDDDDAECGRGLLLMAEIVHDWGVRRLGAKGKVVWARCAR
ncbi:ATP-binding protein [Actinomadura sp. 9N215]|uniref:ATP-binding protein n=1 Tax=Actinomadura sp. 9N215 TaxID=3375150 RepID=UPI00379DF8D5